MIFSMARDKPVPAVDGVPIGLKNHWVCSLEHAVVDSDVFHPALGARAGTGCFPNLPAFEYFAS